MSYAPLHTARRLRYDNIYGHTTWTSPGGETRSIAGVPDALAAIAGLERGFDADAVGLGLHALILTLYARQGYPSDAVRGAVIQAAETLRGVIHPRHTPILDQALAIADRALLTGDDAIPPLIAFTTETVARLDRAAERCGRRAAALLDERDCPLIIGSGAALHWMVQTAADQGVVLHIADANRQDEATVCIVAGACALMNGDMANVHPAEVEIVAAARRRGTPVYALAPDGPTAATPMGSRIPAHLISAIVTDRGVYRPERITAYDVVNLP